MVRVGQQTSSLVSEDDRIAEQGDVLITFILVADKDLSPDLRVPRILQGGEEIWILEGEPALPRVLPLALLQAGKDVVGNAIQLLRREPEPARLVVQILLEDSTEFAQPLLDLLEPITLTPGGNAKAILNVALVCLLQQASGLWVQGLVPLEGRLDQSKHILSHGRLDVEFVEELLGLGRGISELLLGGHGLVEAQDM